ncbi:TPA: hypothetical protein ACOEHG_005148 [Enterobacter ludwigii]|nr:hypothetical protein [Enterobacter ludwigii]
MTGSALCRLGRVSGLRCWHDAGGENPPPCVAEHPAGDGSLVVRETLRLLVQASLQRVECWCVRTLAVKHSDPSERQSRLVCQVRPGWCIDGDG